MLVPYIQVTHNALSINTLNHQIFTIKKHYTVFIVRWLYITQLIAFHVGIIINVKSICSIIEHIDDDEVSACIQHEQYDV